MKHFILALALAFPGIVSAELTKNDMCQHYAEMAEISAKARDKGIPRDAMESWARTEAPNEISEEVTLLAVARVHRYPRLSPREEGNTAYTYCIENWEK